MRVEVIGRLFQDTYSIDLHNHQCWEFVYYTHGGGVVYMNGEPVPFEAGDLFLIPPGVIHGEQAEGGFRNYYCSTNTCDIYTRTYFKLHDHDEAFLQVFERMYLEYHLQRNNWRSIVDTLLQLLNQYVISGMQEPQLNPYVAQAVTDILENMSDASFSVDAMISHYPFQKNYFVRLFKGQMGKTPLQYLTEHRISYAGQLLSTRESSGRSLKEIARMAGFTDYYYFSRVFKKTTGRAPSEW